MGVRRRVMFYQNDLKKKNYFSNSQVLCFSPQTNIWHLELLTARVLFLYFFCHTKIMKK